jgi:uncharacterized paraquat-inducible protein A
MSQFDEEFDDQFDVAEFDDEGVDHDSEPTVTCSNCGFEVLEIAYQCPRCGEIPTREFRQATNQPRWVVLTALLLLGLLTWWILR